MRATRLICVSCAAVSLGMMWPSGGTAQDFEELLREVIPRGLEANGLLKEPRPGPVWLDLELSAAFVRHTRLDPGKMASVISEICSAKEVRLAAAWEGAVAQGSRDSPELQRLIRASPVREDVVGGRSDMDPAAMTSWIREDGTLIYLSLLAHPSPEAFVLEVGVRVSAWYFMPVGVSPVLEVTWTGGEWRIKELRRRVV